MSIRIDGTNTTANPGITGGDADTGLQFGTDEVSIVTGGTERAKVDSSGRLLVGTSSALTGSLSQFSKLVSLGNSLNTQGAYVSFGYGQAATSLSSGADIATINFTDNVAGQFASIRCDADGTTGSGDYPGRLVFSTTADGASTPTERMRIDSSGRLLAGTSSLAALGTVNAYSNSGIPGLRAVGGSSMGLGSAAMAVDKHANVSTTSQVFMVFTVNQQATGCGRINANGPSQAAFGTFSDRRLKENIVDMPPQLENICRLRPIEFDYIESEGGGHQTSFIAQEFEEVYPDAIGEREDGMKTLTGWGKTEAILVKAFQEAVEKINALEARLSALEGGAS